MSTWRQWFRREAEPAAPEPLRWVVADVETSGLDPRRERLLAIAGVALHWDAARRRPRMVPGDSFELRLRHEAAPGQAPDKANILVHGIGVGAQREGWAPGAALQAWRAWAADAPLVGYHSAFDDTALRCAAQACGEAPAAGAWLDLAPLCAVVHEDPRHHPLDHWLARYRIDCLARHEAAADALATAQLLAALWPRVRERTDGSARAVRDFAAGASQMPGRW